jgi:hypothetical protein
VAKPTIIIIEPDLNFAEKLSKSLKSDGIFSIIFQDISNIDKLFSVKETILSIVVNLELKGMEGLTLYSYIKNNKHFHKTTFTFLANNKEVFGLLKNVSLDRAIVLNKENTFKEIRANILQNIPLSKITIQKNLYIPELNGSFSEISIQDLLTFCSEVLWGGKLILHHKNDFAIIYLEYGKITKVYYKDYAIENAIEEFQKWESGGFRLERKKYTVERITKLLSRNKHSTFHKKYTVEINDLVKDLYYFLHLYLSEQMPKSEVDEIFRKEFYLFKNKHVYSDKKLIDFQANTEAKISIIEELTTENLIPIFELFKNIFFKAQELYPELELIELLDYLKELKPYLTEIDFYQHVTEKNQQFEDCFIPDKKEIQENVFVI